MSWIILISSILQILLLVYVATMDVATRLIRNRICLTLAIFGIAGQLANPAEMIESLIAATILFLVLFAVYQRGVVGGGDVKLLAALAVGLPLTGIIQLLTVMAFSGGILAVIHLMMRNLPQPRPAPAGASLVRRVYAVERWRHLRHAPLPYGVAIACGGIWAICSKGL